VKQNRHGKRLMQNALIAAAVNKKMVRIIPVWGVLKWLHEGDVDVHQERLQEI